MENLREWIPYNLSIGDLSNPDTHLVEIEEEWRSVKGFEGYYEISSFGRIKSLDRRVTFSHHKNTNTLIQGQLLKTHFNRRGYVIVGLKKEGKHYPKKIHRLVAEAFIENDQNLPQINHKDGIKLSNSSVNLEWCTNTENRDHAIEKGLIDFKGEKSHKCTITESEAKEIKTRLKMGHRNVDIHRSMNISLGVIEHIKYGNSWTHI